MPNAIESGAASFFLGLLFLCLLFLLSCIVVLGIKAFFVFIKSKLPENIKTSAAEKTEKNPPVKRVRRRVRSIEIDPEEINRISVKRS